MHLGSAARNLRRHVDELGHAFAHLAQSRYGADNWRGWIEADLDVHGGIGFRKHKAPQVHSVVDDDELARVTAKALDVIEPRAFGRTNDPGQEAIAHVDQHAVSSADVANRRHVRGSDDAVYPG